jgi:hypothetical protein
MHDLNGALLPRGRSRRELVHPCLTGTLPDWLPAGLLSGTPAFVGPSTSIGYYKLSGGPGTLALRTIGVDASRQELISFTAEGVWFDSATGINPGLSLKSDTGTCGVAVFHVAGEPTCRLRLLGSGEPDIVTRYAWSGTEMTRRRNLTVAIGVRDKSVWLSEDDQVMHYGTYPGLVLGSVRGVLDASVTGPREMRVCQVRYRMESN